MKASLFVATDSSDTGKHLALDGLKESAATGRDVRHLVGKAKLVDTSHGIAATHERECAIGSGFNHCISHSLRATFATSGQAVTAYILMADSSSMAPASVYLNISIAFRFIIK